MDGDPISDLERGWGAELPDLDVSAMATVARINRVAALIRRRIETEMKANGSSLAEFDVLSALRRQGPPYQLKPSELARTTMLSPSGMTHRLDQLDAAGLVQRVPDPDSRRTAPVALTEAGIAASERLVRLLVEIENDALTAISARDRGHLDRTLTALLAGLSERPSAS